MIINLTDYKSWLELNTDSKRTVKDYILWGKLFIEYCKEDITQENLNNFLKTKLNNKNSFNKVMYAIKKYCEFKKINLEFPKAKQTNQSIKDFITEEQLKNDILKYIPIIFQDYKRVELILKFMFYTGLRAEEVCSLKKDDIDFINEKILIKNTKGKKDRIIPFLNKELFIELKNYISNNDVFNISYQSLSYIFTTIKKECNLKIKFEPRLMRVSFIKWLWGQGVREKVIQTLAGHTSFDTTSIYLDITEDMILKDCKKIKGV